MYLDFAHTSHKILLSLIWLFLDVSKSTDRMANCFNPDQTAPIGAVWSGSKLFAQTYLSEYLAEISLTPDLE